MRQIAYTRMGSLVMALVFAMVLAGCPTVTGNPSNNDELRQDQDATGNSSNNGELHQNQDATGNGSNNEEQHQDQGATEKGSNDEELDQDQDATEKGSNDDDKQSQGAKGLTITDIPAEFNDMYIGGIPKDFGQTYSLYGAEKLDEQTETVTLGKISSGKATLNIWKVTNEKGESYSGSDQEVSFIFYILDQQTMTSNTDGLLGLMSSFKGVGKATVSFTEGTGTCTFTEANFTDLIGL